MHNRFGKRVHTHPDSCYPATSPPWCSFRPGARSQRTARAKKSWKETNLSDPGVLDSQLAVNSPLRWRVCVRLSPGSYQTKTIALLPRNRPKCKGSWPVSLGLGLRWTPSFASTKTSIISVCHCSTRLCIKHSVSCDMTSRQPHEIGRPADESGRFEAQSAAKVFEACPAASILHLRPSGVLASDPHAFRILTVKPG